MRGVRVLDVLFFNARVYNSVGCYLGDHMLVRRGRIAEVGRLSEPPAEGSARLVDLRGGVCVPAFWDSHIHLIETGFLVLGPDTTRARRVDDLLHLISEYARQSNSELVKIVGFDPTLLQDALPTLQQLDEACAQRPLLLSHVEWHACWLNSRAKQICGMANDDSLLVGVQNTLARQRLSVLVSEQDRRRALRAASELLLSRGIGAVHAFEGGALFADEDYDVLVSARDDLKLRVYAYHQVLNADGSRAIDAKRVGGCVPLDGSSGVYTAAVSEPYLGNTGTGVLYYTDKQVQEFVARAVELGLQTSLHACGDRAIAQVIRAHRKHPGQHLRHRIEHVEIPKQAQLPDLAELGLVACVQPVFDHLWGGDDGDYAMTLGAERARLANPLATLVRLGIPTVLGSDSPVTPADPMLVLYAALNHTRIAERLRFWDAFQLISSNAAWVVSEEDELGDIRPGKQADFVVFGPRFLEAKPEQMLREKPLMTVVAGDIVYVHSCQD